MVSKNPQGVKSTAEPSPNWDSNSPLYGVVMAVQANYYRVKVEHPAHGNQTSEHEKLSSFLLCTRRTRLKKTGQKVMVGDRVMVEEPDWQSDRGAIGAVLPRATELHRPPIANASQILLVFALAEPTLDPWQLSRFLVQAESTNLQLCLCLNKSDLILGEQQEQWQRRLAGWGYSANFVSVSQDYQLEQLIQRLQGKITVVAGPSGVGKSSLIDRLIPQVKLRVGAVSGKLQRGRHTTRHVELFELPGGGLLADTPGFNQPDLNCEPSSLDRYFPEIRARLKDQRCQFNNCLHRDEPGCVVRGNWERYEYYLDFLEQAIAYAAQLQQQPEPESNLKLVVKRSGKSQYEPKLETKKYRRPSRKTRQQNWQDIYENQLADEIEDLF
ncbi:MAG: small ribosomal subunit biogenesis GTPase RsgA [Cyanobacteria bacterium J06621_8]